MTYTAQDLDEDIRKEWEHFDQNPHFIVWPGHLSEPLLWAAAPHWASGQFIEKALAGEQLGGYSFSTWHRSLMEAMDWAYHPESTPPKGWRKATSEEVKTIKAQPRD